MEAIFILPTPASVQAFKAFDADLDRIPDPDDRIFAYGLDKKEAFEAPLAGGCCCPARVGMLVRVCFEA